MHNKSFFEYLGISDVERIHSQLFAWLFSPDCLAIDSHQKNKLLNSLFKTAEVGEIKKVFTEVNGIDILVETSNEIIVIENKLKSSQHSNQLFRYKEFSDNQFPDIPKLYYFLTLTGEKTHNPSWRRMSYQDMYEQLKELKLNDNQDHSVIVREYLVFLQRLTTCVKDFMTNPQNYDMVFMDGKKKKIDKIDFEYRTQNERFIASNQLETILQKCFLQEISEGIDSDISYISDTRGDALIDIPIENNIMYNKRKYSTILQLQQNNIKFAFTIHGEGYGKSKKDWVENAIPIMEKLSVENSYSYSKLNKPKSKAYVSISKKLPVNYWKMQRADLINYINEEITNAKIISGNLVIEIENHQLVVAI